MLLGTIVNVCTVILGSLVGLALHKKFPLTLQLIVMQGLGLISLMLAIQMALKMQNPLLVIFSVLIGGIIGEFIHLSEKLEGLGDFVKKKLKIKHTKFTEGLIISFLLFCIGPLTIVGSINEGLQNDHSLLLTKALLDGFSSIALATTYGVGVLFAAVPLFLFQAGISLSAQVSRGMFSPFLINELTATGGILVLGIGLNLLEIKKIKVANFLPALVVIVLLALLFRS